MRLIRDPVEAWASPSTATVTIELNIVNSPISCKATIFDILLASATALVIMPPSGLRLLSLDGGGVRGLSSLYILRDLMARVSGDKNAIAKPCDYFDMIGGTSTGGLIAIMLGRLEMTVEECIRAYKELSQAVFQDPKKLTKARAAIRLVRGADVGAKYESDGLDKAIKKILLQVKVSEDALLKKVDGKCKV